MQIKTQQTNCILTTVFVGLFNGITCAGLVQIKNRSYAVLKFLLEGPYMCLITIQATYVIYILGNVCSQIGKNYSTLHTNNNTSLVINTSYLTKKTNFIILVRKIHIVICLRYIYRSNIARICLAKRLTSACPFKTVCK